MKTPATLLFLMLLLVACRNQATENPSSVVEATPAPAATPAGDSGNPSADAPTAEAIPSPTAAPPTATPLPPKDLTVCVGQEPSDLYLYGDASPSAAAVRDALYEPLYTTFGYAYQPLALEKLPHLADGDALIETVEVGPGDLVYSSEGLVVPLVPGVSVVNASGETVVFDEEPIPMRQMTTTYTFKPLVWSDGAPVKAEDSVFSYEIAVDRGTSRLDPLAEYTAAYEAVDDLTVRWVGVPGYLDPAYPTHVWTPLPRHQLAELKAEELASAPEAAVTPLGYGPFVVESWTPGESIRLIPNEHYYRAAEGLPHLTSLTVHFLEPSTGALPEGHEACDVIAQSALNADLLPLLLPLEEEGSLTVAAQPGDVFEYLIFGVNPADDYAADRPDWFEDGRVRQAVAHCIDRQAIADELTSGRSPVLNTYVSPAHPLYPTDVAAWDYDPTAANALLDEAGYIDDGTGVRQDLAAGTPFSITLGTNSESDVRLRINEMVRDDLAECGLQVNLFSLPAGGWYAPGPVGPVFGRRFDLASFAWLNRIEPNCALFISDNIPGPPEAGYRGWGNANVSGWSNEAFDAACGRALERVPGEDGYEEAHQEALRIFAQELPAVPLFSRLKVAATRPSVLNFRLDAGQDSDLWNVFEWDLATP